MQPYVVRQNDHLAKIAFKFGFDAVAVWNDTRNADLRKLRPDPNLLLAGDLLYIPDQDRPPVMHSLVTGSVNTFVVSDAPTVTVTQTFAAPDATTYASRSFTVAELDGFSAGADDVVARRVPCALERDGF